MLSDENLQNIPFIKCTEDWKTLDCIHKHIQSVLIMFTVDICCAQACNYLLLTLLGALGALRLARLAVRLEILLAWLVAG